MISANSLNEIIPSPFSSTSSMIFLSDSCTLIWYYDEGWLYPTWSDDVYEAAFEEAVKEGKDPVEDWTVIESMIHKLYGDAVYQVANGHDNDIMPF